VRLYTPAAHARPEVFTNGPVKLRCPLYQSALLNNIRVISHQASVGERMNGLDGIIELGFTPWRGYATVGKESVDAGFMFQYSSSVM
jgi:hypothetical protein